MYASAVRSIFIFIIAAVLLSIFKTQDVKKILIYAFFLSTWILGLLTLLEELLNLLKKCWAIIFKKSIHYKDLVEGHFNKIAFSSLNEKLLLSPISSTQCIWWDVSFKSYANSKAGLYEKENGHASSGSHISVLCNNSPILIDMNDSEIEIPPVFSSYLKSMSEITPTIKIFCMKHIFTLDYSSENPFQKIIKTKLIEQVLPTNAEFELVGRFRFSQGQMFRFDDSIIFLKNSRASAIRRLSILVSIYLVGCTVMLLLLFLFIQNLS
ncbi:MAG: hypothetical protein ACXWRE_13505 [Pseudobdellovibrionaceae bacterium]